MRRNIGSIFKPAPVPPPPSAQEPVAAVVAQPLRSPPEILTELPTLGNVEGRFVFVLGEQRLYRYHDGAFRSSAIVPDDAPAEYITRNNVRTVIRRDRIEVYDGDGVRRLSLGTF